MTFYDKIADDVEVAAKELAGNWRKFESFAWDSGARPSDATLCAIVYLSNRDSGCLDKSNEAAILDALSDFTGWMNDPVDGYKFDVETQSHNHWAVGHVDGIVIRCLDTSGNATEAFRAFHALCLRLQDYPVLDEDDFSQRESDEADETWAAFACDDFKRTLKKLAPHHEDLFDAIPESHLLTIWSKIAEESNVCGGAPYESNDQGAYFPFDAVFGERVPAWRRMSWVAVRTIILDIKADEHPMRLARKFDAARKTMAP